jgi:hypothetical protein
MILPGSTNTGEPAGDGASTIAVKRDSKNQPWIKAAGYFGDGEKFKALNIPTARNGAWPFYST